MFLKSIKRIPIESHYTSSSRIYWSISLLLVIAFILKLVHASMMYIANLDINSFGFTEFLINFEGGFVRRGLFGEILLSICAITGLQPQWIILLLSYGAFAFVLIFFFKRFFKLRYCWWLILSPLFLGSLFFLVRKDFILYTALIAMFWLVKDNVPSITHKIIATGIAALGLFLHEAFFFFGIPIFIMLLLSDKSNRVLNYFIVITLVFVFMILCVFKGNIDNVYAIINSWNEVLSDKPIEYRFVNSIGAIGWNAAWTFIMHLKSNIGYGGGCMGIFVQPMFMIAAYYFMTNFLFVFMNDRRDTCKDKTALAALYLFLLLCLQPMFTVLSCDGSRIYQYASVATFSTFVIFRNNRILNMFPKWYINIVDRINETLTYLLPPSKGLMVLLLLFLAQSTGGFSFSISYAQSIIGTISGEIFTCVRHLSYFIL